jgi:hypothetical protein
MKTDYALVLTSDDTPPAPRPATDELLAALRQACADHDCDGFERFSPHPEHARLTLFGDGEPTFAMVEFHAGTPEPLCRLAADASLHEALHAAGVDAAPDAASRAGGGAARWRAGLFRVEREPVPAPRADGAAPLALVVHYHGPVDDAAGFAAHYVAHHPPVLARLPGVREVLCYVPLGTALPGWPADPAVIRNEVRFDSMDALLDALASPVLAELRADSKRFPRFGRSTHYPMTRHPFTDVRRRASSRSPGADAGR